MKQIILYDIRSNYNVGAIFRTADGAGVEKIFLIGLTPTPVDRFGRVVPEIHKTALGAENAVWWEKCTDVIMLVKQLQKEGIMVVAVEQSPHSISLTSFTAPSKVAYIMGSETEGLPESLLEVVDVVLEIPMLGSKESLNVSVAAGIVLYHK